MANQDVALSALRGTTGRDGAVLGLPPIVDHLFDLPALPTLPRRRCRLVRAGHEASAADRPRAPRLLAGATRGGRRSGTRCESARSSSSAGDADRRRARGEHTRSRLRAGRAAPPDRRATGACAAREASGRSAATPAERRGGGQMGRADEPVRRPGGLTRGQASMIRAGRDRSWAPAGRPSRGRSRSRASASSRAAGLATSPTTRRPASQ